MFFCIQAHSLDGRLTVMYLLHFFPEVSTYRPAGCVHSDTVTDVLDGLLFLCEEFFNRTSGHCPPHKTSPREPQPV